MKPLFIKIDQKIQIANESVFRALGFTDILEGDSLNVLNGTYYQVSVLGMTIRLEENSWDYEDDFNFILFIQKDHDSSLKTSDDIKEAMMDVVIKLLLVNLNAKMGIEKENRLQLIS